MTQSIPFDDATVFVEEDGQMRYRAAKPRILAGPGDKPQISLLIAGPTAFLQLTVALGLSSDRLQVIAARLAEDLKLATPPMMQPTLDRVLDVELLLRPEPGTERVLAKAKASGAPPNTAIFNVMVTEVDKPVVQKALAGQTGLLAVRYRLETSVPVATTTSDQTVTVTDYAENELGACFHHTVAQTSMSAVRSALNTQGMITGSATAELDLSEAAVAA